MLEKIFILKVKVIIDQRLNPKFDDQFEVCCLAVEEGTV